MRYYVRARELKAAVLAVDEENKRARLAAELLASDAHGSTAARAETGTQLESMPSREGAPGGLNRASGFPFPL
jgi:hypothetical protein